MLRIGLVQFNPVVGDPEGNAASMLRWIHDAKEAKVDLLVFPELAICGYPPKDLLYYPEFIERCRIAINTLCDEADEMGILLGCPWVNPALKGKDLFNAAVLLNERSIKDVFIKTLLPNYDVFDEYRYFEPNDTFHLLNFKQHKIAVTICEDLWNVIPNPMYHSSPMDELVKLGPTCIVNLAASPFSEEQPELRSQVLQANADQYQLPIYYVNQCGANTDLVFDGASGVYSPGAAPNLPLADFEEGLVVCSFDGKNHHLQSADTVTRHGVSVASVHQALVVGIKDYFRKSGFKKAILGLSGGIDSAVVLALAAEALGAENIVPVMLPSKYSSEHSIADSEALCRNLGIRPLHLPIASVVDASEALLQPYFQHKPVDITEENLQSRIRGLLLMALSNKHGYLLLNTSNKSELSVGYGTLYGDMSGALSVLGDVYKSKVYRQARWINRNHEIIPENILVKAPSAELRPDQKDSDSLPDYAVLDALLEKYIEQNASAEALIQEGFPADVVAKVLKLVNMNEYKRKQAPPVIRITSRCFGDGRRMPIVARWR